jgi:transposase-like protein
VFPATTLQTCIVHLIRNSLDYASWKDRKLLAAALRGVHLISVQKVTVRIASNGAALGR